ncbi:MAG: class I SAM-dependent methyltransferase, partial [Pseudobdellovibrionaceae bacterium]
GGGNGIVAKSCQDLGLKTYLAEPGAGAINAKARGIENVYCCTLNELPEELSFNVVGAFDVVEHIDSPIEFLKDIKSRIKNNGILILTVPAYNLLWSDEDDSAGHCRRYTLHSLQQELTSAGYTIKHGSYFFLPLLPIIFFLRALPYKFKLQKKKQASDKVKSDHVLPKWLDAIFNGLFGIERFFIRLCKLPLGSSIIVVASPK